MGHPRIPRRVPLRVMLAGMGLAAFAVGFVIVATGIWIINHG